VEGNSLTYTKVFDIIPVGSTNIASSRVREVLDFNSVKRLLMI
jgi:hypothetical protein